MEMAVYKQPNTVGNAKQMECMALPLRYLVTKTFELGIGFLPSLSGCLGSGNIGAVVKGDNFYRHITIHMELTGKVR
jgi:hypothetical protein